MKMINEKNLDNNGVEINVGDIRFHPIYRAPFYVLSTKDDLFIIKTTNDKETTEILQKVQESILIKHFDVSDDAYSFFYNNYIIKK